MVGRFRGVPMVGYVECLPVFPTGGWKLWIHGWYRRTVGLLRGKRERVDDRHTRTLKQQTRKSKRWQRLGRQRKSEKTRQNINAVHGSRANLFAGSGSIVRIHLPRLFPWYGFRLNENLLYIPCTTFPLPPFFFSSSPHILINGSFPCECNAPEMKSRRPTRRCLPPASNPFPTRPFVSFVARTYIGKRGECKRLQHLVPRLSVCAYTPASRNESYRVPFYPLSLFLLAPLFLFFLLSFFFFGLRVAVSPSCGSFLK